MTTSLIGRSIGKYVITSVIGEGAMAAVFRAHDPGLGRDVALKVLKPVLAGGSVDIDAETDVTVAESDEGPGETIVVTVHVHGKPEELEVTLSSVPSLSEEEMEGVLDFAFQRYFEDSGLFGTVEDCLARVEELKRDPHREMHTRGG